MRDLPVLGVVRAGHLKELFTFSNATDSRSLPFFERPLIFDAIEDADSFSNGISATNQFFDNRLNLLLGFYRTGTRTGAFDVGNGRYAFDQRICYFPLLDQDNQRWMVFGASGSVRTLPYDTFETANGLTFLPNITFFSRPLVRTGSGVSSPRIISTPMLFSDSGQGIFGLSAQGALGPWTFGGEYLASCLSSAYLNSLPGYGTINGRPIQSVGPLFYRRVLCASFALSHTWRPSTRGRG